ncbi:hypothetical protein KP509_03G030800 [Ceratopteris richardii]|uniref:SAP domain-containing protein n=1 Tax=Ceratopteris richardii TaxID=49495 RepID=A0A8T2VA63_CERRI|nr:hypothetical protein KP509_03G030800 [Ceratopteris richardii]
MDYHKLPRRQLQALCKKHGIPANTTNLEMANALSNLLKPTSLSESEKPEPGLKSVVNEDDAMIDLHGLSNQQILNVSGACETERRSSRRQKCPTETPVPDRLNSERLYENEDSGIRPLLRTQRTRSSTKQRGITRSQDFQIDTPICTRRNAEKWNESNDSGRASSLRKQGNRSSAKQRSATGSQECSIETPVSAHPEIDRSAENTDSGRTFSLRKRGTRSGRIQSTAILQVENDSHSKPKRMVHSQEEISESEMKDKGKIRSPSDPLGSPNPSTRVEDLPVDSTPLCLLDIQSTRGRKDKRSVTFSEVRKVDHKDKGEDSENEGLRKSSIRSSQRGRRAKEVACLLSAQRNAGNVSEKEKLPTSAPDVENSLAANEVLCLSGIRRSRRLATKPSEGKVVQDEIQTIMEDCGNKIAMSPVGENPDALIVSTTRRSRRLILGCSELNVNQEAEDTADSHLILQDCNERSVISRVSKDVPKSAGTSIQCRQRTTVSPMVNYLEASTGPTAKHVPEVSEVALQGDAPDRQGIATLEDVKVPHNVVDKSSENHGVSDTSRPCRDELTACILQNQKDSGHGGMPDNEQIKGTKCIEASSRTISNVPEVWEVASQGDAPDKQDIDTLEDVKVPHNMVDKFSENHGVSNTSGPCRGIATLEDVKVPHNVVDKSSENHGVSDTSRPCRDELTACILQNQKDSGHGGMPDNEQIKGTKCIEASSRTISNVPEVWEVASQGDAPDKQDIDTLEDVKVPHNMVDKFSENHGVSNTSGPCRDELTAFLLQNQKDSGHSGMPNYEQIKGTKCIEASSRTISNVPEVWEVALQGDAPDRQDIPTLEDVEVPHNMVDKSSENHGVSDTSGPCRDELTACMLRNQKDTGHGGMPNNEQIKGTECIEPSSKNISNDMGFIIDEAQHISHDISCEIKSTQSILSECIEHSQIVQNGDAGGCVFESINSVQSFEGDSFSGSSLDPGRMNAPNENVAEPAYLEIAPDFPDQAMRKNSGAMCGISLSSEGKLSLADCIQYETLESSSPNLERINAANNHKIINDAPEDISPEFAENRGEIGNDISVFQRVRSFTRIEVVEALEISSLESGFDSSNHPVSSDSGSHEKDIPKVEVCSDDTMFPVLHKCSSKSSEIIQHDEALDSTRGLRRDEFQNWNGAVQSDNLPGSMLAYGIDVCGIELPTVTGPPESTLTNVEVMHPHRSDMVKISHPPALQMVLNAQTMTSSPSMNDSSPNIQNASNADMSVASQSDYQNDFLRSSDAKNDLNRDHGLISKDSVVLSSLSSLTVTPGSELKEADNQRLENYTGTAEDELAANENMKEIPTPETNVSQDIPQTVGAGAIVRTGDAQIYEPHENFSCENQISAEGSAKATKGPATSQNTTEISKELSAQHFDLASLSMRKLKKMIKERGHSLSKPFAEVPSEKQQNVLTSTSSTNTAAQGRDPQLTKTPSKYPLDGNISATKINSSKQMELPSGAKRSALKLLHTNINYHSPFRAHTPKGLRNGLVAPSHHTPKSSKRESASSLY